MQTETVSGFPELFGFTVIQNPEIIELGLAVLQFYQPNNEILC